MEGQLVGLGWMGWIGEDWEAKRMTEISGAQEDDDAARKNSGEAGKMMNCIWAIAELVVAWRSVPCYG